MKYVVFIISYVLMLGTFLVNILLMERADESKNWQIIFLVFLDILLANLFGGLAAQYAVLNGWV